MQCGLVRKARLAAIHFELVEADFERDGAYCLRGRCNAVQQRSGASFRMIVNTGDWDATLGTNGPGQSGDPESPLYKNLFESWAKDQFFPVYYSKKKIDSVAIERLILKPNSF